MIISKEFLTNIPVTKVKCQTFLQSRHTVEIWNSQAYYCHLGLLIFWTLHTVQHSIEHNILESGPICILRWKGWSQLLCWVHQKELTSIARWWPNLKNSVILSVIYHHRNTLESTTANTLQIHFTQFTTDAENALLLLSGECWNCMTSVTDLNILLEDPSDVSISKK